MTKEKISELRDRTIEINLNNRENRLNKNLREMQDKRSNISLESQKERIKYGAEKVFKEEMVWNISNLAWDINLPMQESEWSPKRLNKTDQKKKKNREGTHYKYQKLER